MLHYIQSLLYQIITNEIIFKVKNKDLKISNYLVQYAYHYSSLTLIPTFFYILVCVISSSLFEMKPL